MIKGLRQTTDVKGLSIGNAFIGGILQKNVAFLQAISAISTNLIKELRRKIPRNLQLHECFNVCGWVIKCSSLHTSHLWEWWIGISRAEAGRGKGRNDFKKRPLRAFSSYPTILTLKNHILAVKAPYLTDEKYKIYCLENHIFFGLHGDLCHSGKLNDKG